MKVILLACCLGLSFYSFAQQSRYLQEVHFEDPAYAFLDRRGSELADILMNAMVNGDIPAYRMHSYGSIKQVDIETLEGKMVVHHEAGYDADGIGWKADEIYYFDDEVYAEGLVYKAIGNDFSNKPVTDADFWTISDASLVNPPELDLAYLDYTSNGSDVRYNYLHFWYEDDFHSEDYYLVSLRIADCEAYLLSQPWVLYREADAVTGHVAGAMFVSDPLTGQNKRLASATTKEPAYTKLQDPLSDDISVNHHNGQVFDLTDGAVVLIGTGKAPRSGTFKGFYSMADFPRMIISKDPRKISEAGSWTEGDMFFDPEAPEVDSDPLSTGEFAGSSKVATPLEGSFLLTEVVEYDLEYPENPDLQQPGKELAATIVEAVKSQKVKALYRDYLMIESINSETFVGELAVRDWDMEEEYSSIPFWDDRESYEEFDKVRVSDTVYISEADFNRGNDPENFGGGFWKMDKILSNTETYKYEEFNRVQLVFTWTVSATGEFVDSSLSGIQPVVGTAYSIEGNPVTPGFLAFKEIGPMLTTKTMHDGKEITYMQALQGGAMTGFPVFSGYIRKK